MIVLALSLFFTEPMPLDMPRAEAFLVHENGRAFLEDRYERLDLWVAQTVTGRWFDEKGRSFVLADLETCPPSVSRQDAVTRTEFAEERVPLPRVRANADFPRPFCEAISILAPCPVVGKPRSPRQLPRGFREVEYWQHPTNFSSIVCAFLPEKSSVWRLATWTLADGDVYDEALKTFETEYLEKRKDEDGGKPAEKSGGKKKAPPTERELLRADARHSVAAYDVWHVTDSDEFTVLDDLTLNSHFIVSLTNDLKRMRAAYAATVPTPVDGSNVLCVARIFASREEYLKALAVNGITDMDWSAAYWSPARRELVAYLPQDGSEKLTETIRHEAFHQYLSYASVMIPVSPWLNEGYAQYFEPGAEGLAKMDAEGLAPLAETLPGLLMMDYEAFYGGTDEERILKYRLAKSVAYFLEKGAPEVRFEPFKDVKKDYFAALLETKDMRQATLAAFKTPDTLKLFVNEWKKFWERQ